MRVGIEMKSRTVGKVDAPPRDDAPFDPIAHPGYLARRLYQICVSVFLDTAKDYNLTHIQFAALVAILHFPGIDQGRLGKLIALDRQTTSNVITRLAQRGLVDRRRKDKRTHALHLTDQAAELLELMRPRIKTIDDTILKPLSAKEQQAFMALLTKLVSHNNALSRAPYEAPF
jgi:DNA-binding MarR family transcriptional regulator